MLLPKSNGFTLETALAELIDNSIDAGSKKLKINKIKQENRPSKGDGDYYTFIFKDEGRGMSQQELEDIIPTLGYEGNYELDSVGHFGIGGRFALLYLCDKGTITITSVKNNLKTKVVITPQDGVPSDEFITIYESEVTKDQSGTEIIITNVVDTVNKTSTIKFLSATYYPQSTIDKEFIIEFVDHNNETTLIEFCDPMYRKKNEKYVRKITFDEEDETFSCWVNGHFVETTGYLFNSDEWTDKDYNYYDNRKDKGFVLQRAGLYLRLAGRYISLGNYYFPGYQPQYYLSRLRVEVNIPKECIETFGIQLNKSKVEIDYENPALRDWYKCIKYIISEAQREKKPAKTTVKEEQEVAEHNKIINDLIKNRGKLRNILEDEKVKNLIPKEKTFPDKTEPTTTKNRPTGMVYDKNQFELRLIQGKDTEPRYMGSRHGNKTIISINTGHPHYQKLIRKLEPLGQRAIFLEYYQDYINSMSAQVNFEYLNENFFYEITSKKDEAFRRIYGN